MKSSNIFSLVWMAIQQGLVQIILNNQLQLFDSRYSTRSGQRSSFVRMLEANKQRAGLIWSPCQVLLLSVLVFVGITFNMSRLFGPRSRLTLLLNLAAHGVWQIIARLECSAHSLGGEIDKRAKLWQ